MIKKKRFVKINEATASNLPLVWILRCSPLTPPHTFSHLRCVWLSCAPDTAESSSQIALSNLWPHSFTSCFSFFQGSSSCRLCRMSEPFFVAIALPQPPGEMGLCSAHEDGMKSGHVSRWSCLCGSLALTHSAIRKFSLT